MEFDAARRYFFSYFCHHSFQCVSSTERKNILFNNFKIMELFSRNLNYQTNSPWNGIFPQNTPLSLSCFGPLGDLGPSEFGPPSGLKPFGLWIYISALNLLQSKGRHHPWCQKGLWFCPLIDSHTSIAMEQRVSHFWVLTLHKVHLVREDCKWACEKKFSLSPLPVFKLPTPSILLSLNVHSH